LIERLAEQQGIEPTAVAIDLISGEAEVALDYDHLVERTEALRRLERHCENCPANLWTDSYGCIATVRYPITPEAEGWLLDQLPDDLTIPPGAHLLRAINHFQIDGVKPRLMRQQGLVAAPAATTRSWDGTSISSDELLELLLFTPLAPGATRLLTLLFNVVEPVPEQDVPAVLRGELVPRQAMYLRPDDSPSIADFKRLFLSTLVAGQLGVTVRVAP
jgi:hypothetical protein